MAREPKPEPPLESDRDPEVTDEEISERMERGLRRAFTLPHKQQTDLTGQSKERFARGKSPARRRPK